MNEDTDIGGNAPAGPFVFGPFELTATPLALTSDGREVPLRHQALRLLLLFVRRPGRLVGHDEIRRHVWGSRYVDHVRGTHLLVGEIRQALADDARNPRYLETLPRQGYRFVAPVRHGPAARRRHAATIFRRARTWLAGTAAAGIVAAVALVLGSAWPDLAAPPTSTPGAAAAYAKAMHLVDRRTPEALRLAQSYLSEASRSDPASADVQAALAKVARLESDFDAAEDRARRALSLAPDHAAAHLELGIVLAMRDWDWRRAERHVRAAIMADPASAEAHAAHAALLTVLGRHADALEASGRAYAADPVSALVRVDHGWFHYYAGDYETAWRVCGEAVRLADDSTAGTLCQYKAASMSGNEPRALDAAARLAERWRAQEPATRAELGRDLSGLDAFRRARRMRIERLREADEAPPEAFATAYAEVGNLPSALAMLELAFERRSAGLPLVLRDPVFAPLRDEPRFRRLVRGAVPAGDRRG